MSTYYFSLWQAVWRGYILRVRLEQALEFAKFEDEDDFDFQEVDLKDFNFNEVCGLHTAQLKTCCFSGNQYSYEYVFIYDILFVEYDKRKF